MGIEVEKERERGRVRAASYDSTKGGRDLRGISDPHLLLAPWRNRQREVGKLGYPDNFLRSKDPVATRNTFPPSFSFVLFLSLSLRPFCFPAFLPLPPSSIYTYLYLPPKSLPVSRFRLAPPRTKAKSTVVVLVSCLSFNPRPREHCICGPTKQHLRFRHATSVCYISPERFVL